MVEVSVLHQGYKELKESGMDQKGPR